ncbi:FAD dependent oxidoreductase [Marasmius fiardii PR-910]|nr:FAD dependent oxidoreductase [Marasmius fiardii PR-910]
MASTSRDIVIIGGGIIGCSTAYHLSRHPSFSPSTTIKVIEASIHGIAQGASGKAGGLIAKWAYPSEIVRVSFPEHIKLANDHNGKERWGFRFVQAGSWEGNGVLSAEQDSKRNEKSLEKTLGLEGGAGQSGTGNSKTRQSQRLPEDLLWVEENLTDGYSSMAPEGDTAQVHPYLFTTSMMNLAKEKGVELVQGRVTSILRDDGKVTGVVCEKRDSTEKETITATDIILTAGAWSPSLIPSLPVDGIRAHSITIHPDPSVKISPHVLFTSIQLPTGTVTPEIYARPGNEVYACSGADDCPLPETVDDVKVDSSACDALHQSVGSISTELRKGKLDKKQACFLPIVRRGGGPIIGAVPKIAEGLYIAVGHTCWGISNAPGTGKILAELVMEGKVSSTNMKNLQPSRFL